jgi:predicted RecB family endonuclease
MASPANYKDTLNKMANLEELSKFVLAQNVALEASRGKLIKTLSDMQSQVSNVRDEMDNIKSKGATATTEMRQVITDADQKQVGQLNNIKAMITNMTKMDKLDTAVKSLENDINTLAKASSVGTGHNAAATTFVPGSAKPTGSPADNTRSKGGPKPPPSTVGGYTYGKSRKKGNGRRKRTKKSRKKRTGKK